MDSSPTIPVSPSWTCRVRKGETCFGWVGWLGKVRLAINALLVKGWFGEHTFGEMAVGELTIRQNDVRRPFYERSLDESTHGIHKPIKTASLSSMLNLMIESMSSFSLLVYELLVWRCYKVQLLYQYPGAGHLFFQVSSEIIELIMGQRFDQFGDPTRSFASFQSDL